MIEVPALNPYKVFFSASVPVKESPAFVPPTVLPCASEVTPPPPLPPPLIPPLDQSITNEPMLKLSWKRTHA